MFRNNRRQKLRNQVIAAALGVAVMTFGIWLNYSNSAEDEEAENTVQKVTVDEESTSNTEGSAESEKVKSSTDTDPEERTYLIKEVDGVVKVFICDNEGNEELYLITSIPFDVLSESDQQLFVDGVVLKEEEDIGKFLENFDS